MIETWPLPDDVLSFDVKEMDLLMEVIYTIRNARGELAVSPAEKVGAYFISDKKKLVDENADIVMTLAKLNAVNFTDKRGDTIVGREVAGFGFAGIDVKGVVDTAREIEKLRKSIDKFGNGIKIAEAKLANTNFTANAPKKLIDEEHDKIEKFREDIKQANATLALLEKIR
jgi:valyl-tRNA synthetase